MQIILLLIYLSLKPDSPRPVKKRKRRRRREDDIAPTTINPRDDPEAALELLTDRISVWLAVSDLGLGLGSDGSDKAVRGQGTGNGLGKKPAEEGVEDMLKRFWEEIILES
jgi:hypothetical protein